MNPFGQQLFHLLLGSLLLSVSISIYRYVSQKLTGIRKTHRKEDRRLHEDLPENPVEEPPVSFRDACRNVSFRHLPEALLSFFRTCVDLCRTILYRLCRPRTFRAVLSDLFFTALVSLALAVFCNTKTGSFDLYMSTFLPILLVLFLLFAFTEAVSGSRLFAFGTSILIICGIALQLLLKPDAASAERLVLYTGISIVLALAAFPVLQGIVTVKKTGRVLLFLNGMTVVLYLVLLLGGKTVNSTRAWIAVGSMTFQLTEVTKVLAGMVFALAFTDGTRSPSIRLRTAFLTLLMNALFLLVINEFGTLCVMGILFYLLALVYLPSLKLLARLTAVLAFLGGSVLAMCYGCYRLRYPVGADGTVTVAETNGIIAQGAKIYNKIALRFALLFQPETVDRNNGGYQLRQAKDALALSDWLGSSYEVDIPVVESDAIFDYLLLKMGVLFGILVIVLLLCVLLNTTFACLRNPDSREGAVGLAFLFCIVFQAFLAASSATGMFLTIGLPFPFLADGGSSLLMNYMMVIYILYTTKERALTAPERRRARRIHPTEVSYE